MASSPGSPVTAGRCDPLESAEVTCTRYDTWDALVPFKAHWDRLAGSLQGGIAATFDWQRVWWRFYGRQRRLEIYLVWRAGDLVGLFPLFRETQWLGGLPVRVLRMLGGDYPGPCGGVPIRKGDEQCAVDALADCLEENGGPQWDALYLGPIGGYVEDVSQLVDAFRMRFPESQVCSRCVSPWVLVDVPKSMEEYYRGFSKRQRDNLRRQDRLLRSAHETAYRVYTTAEELEPAFERFLAAHDHLWEGKGDFGWFNEWPKARAFHRALVRTFGQSGKVVIAELIADGNVIGSTYVHWHGGVMHYVQTTRDPSPQWNRFSLGSIAMVKVIEEAIKRGCRSVDLGGSPVEYKLHLGGRLSGATLLTVVRPGFVRRLRLGCFEAAAWALHTGYARLWRGRMVPALELKQKAFRDCWIRSRLDLP